MRGKQNSFTRKGFVPVLAPQKLWHQVALSASLIVGKFNGVLARSWRLPNLFH